MRLFLVGIAMILPVIGLSGLWTFVIALGGMPGAAIFKLFEKYDRAIFNVPTMTLTMIGQVYVSLAWAAFVIQSGKTIIGTATGPGKWFFWAVILFASILPAYYAYGSIFTDEKKTIQHVAAYRGFRFSVLGALLFAVWPDGIAYGWQWVPYF